MYINMHVPQLDLWITVKKTNEDIATRFEQEYIRRREMNRNVSVVRA
jgi:hypothetical protein